MTDAGERMLAAWVGLAGLLSPIGRLIVARRRRSGKEDPIRWTERLGGQPGTRRPGGPLVWVHAASVGESVAVRPLVERLIGDGLAVVMTTVTVTGAGLVARWSSDRLHHRFVPLDLPAAVDGFLDDWRPDLALFVESEIWPVTLARLKARGIPLAICNARMSDRSFRGWRRFPGPARALFGRIRLCLAQSEEDAARFKALGAPSVVVAGNIKFDAAVPEAPAADADALGLAIAGRPVLLAASTHPGEDEIVLTAVLALKAGRPGLLAVIAPRHPERGPSIAGLAEARGLSVRRRSAGTLPDETTDLYVADTVGELGSFYRLATVAFVGGSLVPIGGHNPIEAARLGAPVLTGPHLANFREVYDAFLASGAAEAIEGAADLAAAAARLLDDPAERARRQAAAARLLTGYTGALDRTFAHLAPLLPATGGSRRKGAD